MNIHKQYTVAIGGKEMIATFSDLAEQAHGSVILTSEGTVVMATAVMSRDGRNNPGFFNLTVEYLEKYYAAGAILGSRFMRREGRPTTSAILGARVIDRTIRPLFEKHIKNAVQVIVTVVALGKGDPVVMGINAASLALATSDIPWGGPVGAVHIGKFESEGTDSGWVVNEYIREHDSEPRTQTCDIIACGRDDTINMIEAEAREISEDEAVTVFTMAQEAINELSAWQEKIVSEIGREKRIIEKPELPQVFHQAFRETMVEKIDANIFGPDSKKFLSEYEDEWVDEHVQRVLESLESDEEISSDDFHELRVLARDLYNHYIDEVLHREALANERRADGRALDEVRDLYAQAGGISPSLHGSGIFYRGGTHVMSVLTLGGPQDTLMRDEMEVQMEDRFMHHYNFPPYSAGETGRVGGINRRETGHGVLAEKALRAVIPPKEVFPYTIRVVSESTASNGSTSQASICASTLALMDGGVPITRPVAGIAMGVMVDPSNASNYKVLTDIQGPEDHHGDMDFKIAGTREGITAIQLDIKVDGVSLDMLRDALAGAKKARLHILDTIEAEISAPRSELQASAPQIEMLTIPTEKIGLVIGRGGETIQKLQEETQTTITIEDDGSVFITAKGGNAKAARATIEALTKEWKEGELTEGEIIKIIEVGAIVKIGPATDGLVHISKIAPFRVERVADVLKEGMMVPVKVVAVDKEKGRISLSIVDADKNFISAPNNPSSS